MHSRPLIIGRHRWTTSAAEVAADGAVHLLWLSLAVYGAFYLGLHERASAHTLAYIASLVAVATISLAYNMAPLGAVKAVLSRVDQAAIYTLIAGTCGAFLALTEATYKAATILAVIWILSSFGSALKLAVPDRFERLGLVLYLGIGWMTVLLWGPLSAVLGTEGVILLVAGGLSYTAGVPIFLNERLRYRAALWHAFVLVGASCHLIALIAALEAV